MSVSLWIGSTTSPANAVNKTVSFDISSAAEYACELKQPCDVTHPVFIVQETAKINKLDNYAYCQQFGRYYFAEISLTPQGYVISCTCDPLMSFKSNILTLNCVIARNEKVKQGLISDSSYVTTAKDTLWFKDFPVNTTDGSWFTRALDTGRRFILIKS